MTSVSFRRIMSRYHGVDIGNFAYGSLLDVGMADRLTSVGAYCSIGPNVRRFGAAHPTENPLMHAYWYNPVLGYVGPSSDVSRSACRIEPDVWIGANVVILPGCRRIGLGAVVGAGSVVTRDIGDFEVWAGVPARKISERLTPAQRSAVRAVADWSAPPHIVERALSEGLEVSTE